MIDAGCPNCASVGHNGALFAESYKAEGKYYIEITCVNCAQQFTPANTHTIVEYFLSVGQLEKAQRVEKELQAAVDKELRPLRR